MLGGEASRVYWRDEPAAGEAALEGTIRRLYATEAPDLPHGQAGLGSTRTVAALALHAMPDGGTGVGKN